MATAAQTPVYLDEQGNPQAPASAPAASALATQPTTAPTYLDEQGNPQTPQGPTIGPAQPASAKANPATATDPFQKAGRQMTGGFARLLMDATDKLREVENFTKEGREAHPIQAHLGDIANKIEGYLFGNEQHPEAGIGTGKYGMLTHPITSALIPGAEGEPVLAAGIRGGASLVKSGVQGARELMAGGKVAGEAAEKAPGIVKKVLHGEKVAQAPARQALEAGAKASAEDAGVTASKTAGKGLRTLLDEPIATTAKAERGAYDTINKAAGTDLKSLYDYRTDLHDALEDPTNIGQKVNLQQELKTTEEAIAKGEAQATKSGITPEAVKKAEGMTQQRYAMENLKQKLFNNESVVEGNVGHGAEESINVKAAIREIEKLDKPSKFAPEGTPTRLVQALGEKGAAGLKQGLYDAQKAGQSALTVRRFLKIAGTILGIGGVQQVVREAIGH